MLTPRLDLEFVPNHIPLAGTQSRGLHRSEGRLGNSCPGRKGKFSRSVPPGTLPLSPNAQRFSQISQAELPHPVKPLSDQLRGGAWAQDRVCSPLHPSQPAHHQHGCPHAVWSLSPGPPTQRLLSGAGNPGALSGGSCNTQHCLCPGLLCSVPCKELRPSHGQPGHKPGLILPPCVGVSTLHLNGAFQPSLQGGSNFPISLTPNQEPQLYPSVSASCLPGLGVAPQAPLPPIFLLQARALHLPRDSQRT